jgi:hypothetical protein
MLWLIVLLPVGGTLESSLLSNTVNSTAKRVQISAIAIDVATQLGHFPSI